MYFSLNLPLVIYMHISTAFSRVVHFISPCFVLFSRFSISSARYIWRVYTPTLRIKIVAAENEFSSF